MKSQYDRSFFRGRSGTVKQSAEVIVQHFHEKLQPKSVVDVGCGDGAWLAEWSRCGTDRIKGIDGDWVNEEILKIPVEHFEARDLNQHVAAKEKFDLCTSLEVAEHLQPDNAQVFVRTLTGLSDFVIFSAAIPGQGGTGHFNEQWQEYWIEQFRMCGFTACAAIGPELWESENVQPCYLQNALVYIKESELKRFPSFPPLTDAEFAVCRRRVHPRLWSEKNEESRDLTRFGCLALIKAIPRSISRAVSARLQS